MSFGVQTQVWKPTKPSASLPSRVSVQTAAAGVPTAKAYAVRGPWRLAPYRCGDARSVLAPSLDDHVPSLPQCTHRGVHPSGRDQDEVRVVGRCDHDGYLAGSARRDERAEHSSRFRIVWLVTAPERDPRAVRRIAIASDDRQPVRTMHERQPAASRDNRLFLGDVLDHEPVFEHPQSLASVDGRSWVATTWPLPGSPSRWRMLMRS